jgi:hypothetical protein
MEKDDYEVLVFKILTYLYAILKRKQVFDNEVFTKAVIGDQINKDYLNDILIFMEQDGLINGLQYKKIWGNQSLIINDLNEMKITPEGIHYLNDNSKMKEIKDFLIGKSDIIATLIKIVF